MEPLVSLKSRDNKSHLRPSSDSEGRKRKNRDRTRPRCSKEKGDILLEVKKLKENIADGDKCEDTRVEEKDGAEIQIQITNADSGNQKLKVGDGEDEGAAEEQPSEASDSCHTDSRILTSPSSDSLDALEEDDLISCSSSSSRPNTVPETRVCVRSPFQLHLHSDGNVQPHLLAPPPAHSHPLIHLTAVSTGGGGGGSCSRSGDGAYPQTFKHDSSQGSDVQNPSGELCSVDSTLCFAELSRLADLLPSPPEASEEDEEEELRRRKSIQKETSLTGGCEGRGGSVDPPRSPSPSSPSSHKDYVFNFIQSDARCYYNLCSNITPDSTLSPPRPHLQEDEEAEEVELTPILQPPPGFGDSSSDEEFFDARDGFASPEDLTSGAVQRGDSDSSQHWLGFFKSVANI